jgi:cytokinin riboside 5'-monophosphate phosphoribohydrolase
MRVCVFGSSSRQTLAKYYDESVRLGTLIAQKGHILVNGAGRYGVMGGVNEGAFTNNGHVQGVIHRSFYVDHGEDSRIKDLVITDGWDLSERKDKLFANSDCIMIMPGGVGTFDEFWDGVSSKALGMKGMTVKPIVVVNIDGYYDGFLEQLHRAQRDGILYHQVEDYFHIESDVEKALDYCIKHAGELQSAHSGHCNHSDDRKVERSSDAFAANDSKLPSQVSEEAANPSASCQCCKSVVRHALVAVTLVGLGVLIGMKIRK